MADNRKTVLLYRTTTSGLTPSAENIEHGELALNYNANTPFIAFKDADENIQKVGSLANTTGSSEFHTMTQKAVTDAINDAVGSVEHKISSGYTEAVYPDVKDIEGNNLFVPATKGQNLDEAIKTVDTNVATLVGEVLDNEMVVASTMTKLNESCGFNDNGDYVKQEGAQYIADAESLVDADIKLDSALHELENSLGSLSGTIISSSDEVWVGTGEPTIESIEIFVDESVDPLSVDVYSKAEVDATVESLQNSDTALTQSVNEKVVYGADENNAMTTNLFVDTSASDSVEVYTKAQVDAIIAKLKLDNNLI